MVQMGDCAVRCAAAFALAVMAAEAAPLRFMSFNIYGAGYGGFMAEEREERAIAVVRRQAPDLVSWQEVNGGWWDSRLFKAMEAFSCGNGLHVHDLVDLVSEEGERAAEHAAAYLAHTEAGPMVPVTLSGGIRYVLPRQLTAGEDGYLSMRVTLPGRDQKLTVTADGKVLVSKKMKRVMPSEMIRVRVKNVPVCEKVEVSLT